MFEDMNSEKIVDELDEIEHVIEGEDQMKNGSGKDNDNEEDKDADENNKDKDKAKIKKKIGPRVILNATRLKGPRGIGIMESFFSDINLEGKRKEREDLDLVMMRLEHWAHRLIPRMQFDDCLKKIEKLGTKKEISNYMKRIRLGMEENDDLTDVLEDAPDSPPPPEDPFDLLLSSSSVPAQAVNTDMSTEQREQMLRNRLIAEERRAARIERAQKLRDGFKAKHTVSSQIENVQTTEREDEAGLSGDNSANYQSYGNESFRRDIQDEKNKNVGSSELEYKQKEVEIEIEMDIEENKHHLISYDGSDVHVLNDNLTVNKDSNSVSVDEKSDQFKITMDMKPSHSETTTVVNENLKDSLVMGHSNSGNVSIEIETEPNHMKSNKDPLCSEGVDNQCTIVMEKSLNQTNELSTCDNQGNDLLAGSGSEQSVFSKGD